MKDWIRYSVSRHKFVGTKAESEAISSTLKEGDEYPIKKFYKIKQMFDPLTKRDESKGLVVAQLLDKGDKLLLKVTHTNCSFGAPSIGQLVTVRDLTHLEGPL